MNFLRQLLNEGDVIQFPKRKEESVAQKIQKVATDIPKAFDKQREAEPDSVSY